MSLNIKHTYVLRLSNQNMLISAAHPPVVSGFRSMGYSQGDTRTVYICEDTSKSIDISSGDCACPVIDYKNSQWSNFTATCGQGRYNTVHK